MWTACGRTDMTKLIVAFRYFANAIQNAVKYTSQSVYSSDCMVWNVQVISFNAYVIGTYVKAYTDKIC